IWPCSMWGLQSRSVAEPLVRSYRTFSTLPEPFGHRRYIFCCTFRPLRALELRGTAPCGARTFLCIRQQRSLVCLQTSKNTLGALIKPVIPPEAANGSAKCCHHPDG